MSHTREVLINVALSIAVTGIGVMICGYLLFVQLPEMP